jgi:hypothetical protein
MTKMTVVTDSSGKLIAAVNGHSLASKQGEVEAKVSFAPGHKLHNLEVEDEIGRITDAAMFQDRLLKYLPKS